MCKSDSDYLTKLLLAGKVASKSHVKSLMNRLHIILIEPSQ